MGALSRIGQLLFGHNHLPQTEGGESVYDAMLRNRREVNTLEAGAKGFSNNPILQRLGVSNHPLTRLFGYGDAVSGGRLGEKLSPVLGGNPTRAAMTLAQGLQNPSVLQGFGKQASEARAVQKAMQQLYKTNPELHALKSSAGGTRSAAAREARELKKMINKGTYEPAHSFFGVSPGEYIEMQNNFTMKPEPVPWLPYAAHDPVEHLPIQRELPGLFNNVKKAAEKLKGGFGDNKPDSLFNRKELRKGIAHELEHTGSKGIAKEIAKDHLSERGDYYTALSKAKIGCLVSAFIR
jgi:hypothetical protein